MEKITAYKAFNGKLFESEEKCLAYEKKMSAFPKHFVNEKTNSMFDIVLHEEYVKTAPNQPKERTERYIIINKKIKLSGHLYPVDVEHVLNFNEYDLAITEQDSKCWGGLLVYLTKLILRFNNFNDKFAEQVIDVFNKDNHLKVQITDSKPNKMWYFEDIRWHYGFIAMNGVRVELID